MSWKLEYVIMRKNESGELSVVHESSSLKDARYWLTYIALAGDAMFQTPIHPKYKGDGKPIYMAHLIKRGKLSHNEQLWRTETGAVTSQGASA